MLNHCGFATLFSKNVPHILEKIFSYLDYNSYKKCLEVNKSWKELLTSEKYKLKGKSVFNKDILKDECKLLEASQRGDQEEVRTLLLSGMVNVNGSPSHLFSAMSVLSVAAHHGHVDVVRLLLESGADPNKASKDYLGYSYDTCTRYCNRTPLHHAVSSGNIGVVQLLLDAGADPNTPNSLGETPLYLASKQGFWHIFQIFLNLGVVELPLIMAAERLDETAMINLLEAGADPNMTDLNGETPLIAAIRSNPSPNNLNILLDYGAEPNKTTKYGDAPLHFAAMNNNYASERVVQVLIDAGADLNMANIMGMTPLHKAAQYGREEVVKLMIDSGADQNKTNDEGKTPLDLAPENDRQQVVNILTGEGPPLQPRRNRMRVRFPRINFSWRSLRL